MQFASRLHLHTTNKPLLLTGWLSLPACQSAPETTLTNAVPTPKQRALRPLQSEVKADGEAPEEDAPDEWP